MNAGPSGFQNAPVTKGLILICGVASIIAAIQGRPTSAGLSYQAILKKVQLWRLITSIFVFASTSETMFGLYLVYYFRVFERQIGSNKYSVLILFSLAFSLILELFSLILFKGSLSGGLASGPYGVIFSLFVPFFIDIPTSTRFQIFSVRLSDKSFVYIAGLQLLLSSWKKSLIPGICGILAGICYRMNIFKIQSIKVPKLIASTSSWLFSPLISSGSSNAPSRRPVRGGPVNVDQVNRAAPAVVASEDAIALLVSMGFDRASAAQALVQTRNDVNAAADLLLNNQSR